MFRNLRHRFGLHPRAWARLLLTYPRFLGQIKPGLMNCREEEVSARLRALERCWAVSRLKPPLATRLLFIAPHPDDESIGAGGLLLAHRGRAATHVINVFNGESGGELIGRPRTDDADYKTQLIAARRQELGEVGRRLGLASVQYLEINEGIGRPIDEGADRLREAVNQIRPDLVVLPWFLDNHPGHRVTNVMYAWSCQDLDCMVLGCEIWSLCQPNAVLDISGWLEEKLEIVRLYQTQLATDYCSYVRGLALTRGFLHSIRPDRRGAAEAFFALPNRDYCDLVLSLYGEPSRLTPAGQALL